MLQVRCHPVDFNKIWLWDVSLQDCKQKIIFVASCTGVQEVPVIPQAESIKKLKCYGMSASRPAQLIFVVIPRMEPKMNDFNKMFGVESADDTKQGVWPPRFKDWIVVGEPNKQNLNRLYINYQLEALIIIYS